MSPQAQTVDAHAGPAAVITLRLGDEHFAIDVGHVREILDLTEITRVPTAPSYLRGVANVRGSAVPVVDLRLKFGLPPQPDTVLTRIVVLEVVLEGETTVVGGLADSVHDVVAVGVGDLRDAPRIGLRWRPDLIRGLLRRGEQFVMVLDIERVFATDGSLLADAGAEAFG